MGCPQGFGSAPGRWRFGTEKPAEGSLTKKPDPNGSGLTLGGLAAVSALMRCCLLLLLVIRRGRRSMTTGSAQVLSVCRAAGVTTVPWGGAVFVRCELSIFILIQGQEGRRGVIYFVGIKHAVPVDVQCADQRHRGRPRRCGRFQHVGRRGRGGVSGLVTVSCKVLRRRGWSGAVWRRSKFSDFELAIAVLIEGFQCSGGVGQFRCV